MKERIKLLNAQLQLYYTKIKEGGVFLKSKIKAIYDCFLPYILSLYKFFRYAFFPRFIIIIWIWIICRTILFYLWKLHLNITFVPFIEYEYMSVLIFLKTLLDVWVFVSIIAFFIVTLYRTVIEIKNERI